MSWRLHFGWDVRTGQRHLQRVVLEARSADVAQRLINPAQMPLRVDREWLKKVRSGNFECTSAVAKGPTMCSHRIFADHNAAASEPAVRSCISNTHFLRGRSCGK